MKIRLSRMARVAACLSPLVLHVAAHAQSTGSALTDTVVTANRTEQPLSDLLSDVSIVDRETIARSGAVGVADVLARLPGIEVARNGGPGNTTSVFLRGAESRFTAVYLDGVRIDSQSTGGVQWEQIPLAQIDRIEVLRGPAAAVYGSDAIGGVIQLFTRKGEAGFHPYVGIGGGTHGTGRLEAGASGTAGVDNAFDYSLGVAREISNGFNAREVATQNPDKDGYRSTSANARLGFRIDARNRLDATFLANDLESQYDNSRRLNDKSNHTLRTAGLTYTGQWTDFWKATVQATASRSVYETQPSVYRTETELHNYLFQNEFRFGEHLFTAALERREDNLQNTPIDRDRSQNGIALGYALKHGAHTLQLHGRHDDDSEFGGKNTGSAAYGYAINSNWRATASVGTAFRAPTLYQRFSEYGLGSLRPETSRNVEAALHWSQGASSASVTVYRNKVDNLISFGAAGGCGSTFGCYRNTAHAQYEGVTFAGAHKLGAFALRGSLDLQDPKDEDTGRQLARRAKQHAVLGADTRFAGVDVGAEMQASAHRWDNAANTTRLGGYTLFNLYASTRIARDYSLVARIDNLADKFYQTANTYATAGRVLYVGVKWAPQ
ncbi:TonB-dependent receptor domain-containing protein [Xylophilus sp. GOD-11R]|uniref:TonB-dependent receptor domain-containing protein n=1 Tax=Xylophilus sp. GOD-11R TaxID=3089814 RepID=UPI00298CD9F9|nr:TonB-dependent receptor [Xylophilus sp. GOD-11R]WPB58554.1 TonB-dependent receptor [Xylophilus sp. GOD-11R]